MSEGKIYKMFLDPTGRHLIITTESGDNYYLYAKWKKAKLLSKIKVLREAHIACKTILLALAVRILTGLYLPLLVLRAL